MKTWQKMFYERVTSAHITALFAAVVLGLLVPYATMHAAEENLIRNPSLEERDRQGNPAHWTRNQWGNLSAAFRYPVSGMNGGRAARVQVYWRQTGDAKWMSERVSVESNATYHFSNYYRSSQETKLVAEFVHHDGSLSYQWFATLSPQSSWTQTDVTVVVPENVNAMRMFHLIDQPGWLVTDEYSLRKTSGGSSGGDDDSGGDPGDDPGDDPGGGSGGDDGDTGGGSGGGSAGDTVWTQGMVSVTFDDAWLSQYENALPLMSQYGIRGTFYITTDPVVLNWDGFMREGHLHEIAAAGHEIGSHTVTHAELTHLSDADLRDEVVRSKQVLENMGFSVKTLAYPYGSFDARVENALRDAGYTGGRTTQIGLNTITEAPYRIRSASPVVNTPLEEIKADIDRAIANNEWYVIAFHEIDHSGATWSNSPEYLEAVLAYIQERGIRVVTMAEGVEMLQ